MHTAAQRAERRFPSRWKAPARIIALLAMLVCAAVAAPSPALAAGVEVVRDDITTTLPPQEIYINYEKLTYDAAEFTTTNSVFVKQKYVMSDGSTSYGVSYDPSGTSAITSDTSVTGSFTLKWYGVGRDADGDAIDLALTFSDYTIHYLASGADHISIVRLPKDEYKYVSFGSEAYSSKTTGATFVNSSLSQTMTMSITKSGTSTAASGAYLAAFKDLDTCWKLPSGVWKAESIQLLSGYGSTAWVDTSCVLEISESNTKFGDPSGTWIDDESTWKSGFAVQLSSTGSKIRWTGSRCGTVIFEKTVQPTVTATMEGSGTIAPEGTGTYNWKADQRYDMDPFDGYHVEDVLVDAVSVGAQETYLFVNLVADHVIHAVFAANTYTVTYDGNGATGGSTADSTHTYDVAKTLTKNGYSKTGYSFAGWNWKADGSGTSTADAEVTSPTAYAAIYGGTHLVFGRAISVPSTYTTPEGATLSLTKAYASPSYDIENLGASTSSIPWYSYRASIQKVAFIDEISPKSTAYWFDGFSNCTSLDLGLLNTSNTTNMKQMFYQCGASELDLSNMSTAKATNMSHMLFAENTTLIVGENFSFSGSGSASLGLLGKIYWRSSKTGEVFDYQDFPNNTPDRYTYYSNNLYAHALILDNSANSSTDPYPMVFVRDRTSSISVGSTYDTSRDNSGNYGSLKVLYSYTGFEDADYNVDAAFYPPWLKTSMNGDGGILQVTSVTAIDPITPTSMSEWFNDCPATTMNLANIDATNCVDVSYAFVGCTKLSNLTLPKGFGVGAQNMQQTFYKCTSLATLNLPEKFGQNLFHGNAYACFMNCSSLTSLDLGEMDTRYATKLGGMFSGMSSLQQVTLGENFSFVGDESNTAAILPTPSSGYWYSSSGNGYTPATLQSSYSGSTMAGTYYASASLVAAASTASVMSLADDGSSPALLSVANVATATANDALLAAADGGTDGEAEGEYGVSAASEDYGIMLTASGTNLTDQQSVVNLTTINGAKVKLYAQWSPITYQVKYNANGGSGSMSNSTFTYDQAGTLTANAFTRDGYTFAGWATSASGGVAYADKYVKPASTNWASTQGAVVNLYAVWTENASYYLDLNGLLDGSSSGNISGYGTADVYINGSLVADNATDYWTAWPTGTTYTIKDIRSTTGHTYQGVSSGSVSGTITAATTVQLKFKTNAYTVAYNANGGAGTTASSSHTYGTAKNLTANGFTRSGYSFTGWSLLPDGYTRVEYIQSTGTQWIDTGYVYKSLPTVEIDYATTSHKNSEIFGWGAKTSSSYLANDDSGYDNRLDFWNGSTWVYVQNLPTAVTSRNTVTLTHSDGNMIVKQGSGEYAHITYAGSLSSNTLSALLFNGRGGTTYAHIGKLYGARLYDGSTLVRDFIPVIDPSGAAGLYDLVEGKFYGNAGTGSFTAGSAVSSTFTDQQSVTNLSEGDGVTVNLYAQWTPNPSSYTVAYNANGGSGTTASSSHTYGTAKNLTANGFTRTGYAFTGWNTLANGSLSSVSLTNLAPSYTENDTTHAKYGDSALKITGTTSTPEVCPGVGSVTLDSSHKYYVRYEHYQEEACGSFGLYWPIAEPSFVEGQAAGTAGQWNVCSAVNTRSSFSSGTYDMRIDFNNSYVAGSAWIDGLVVIDLTAAFGAGNEPDAAWCDVNIPYFTGTTTVKTAFADQESVINLTSVNGGTVTMYAQWTASSFTDTINHWMWGFENGEGNNGNQRAFHITDTSFTALSGTSVTLSSSNATTIPNGYYLASQFGTSAISGTWTGYTMPYTFTQAANNMGFEYDYHPYSYTITYDYGIGTAPSSNPSSYNVLYGVTFSNPTAPAGYTFDGYYIDGEKVTGINVGADASFTSQGVSAMYAALADRTTGDKTVVAKYTPNSYYLDVNGLLDGTAAGNTDGYGTFDMYIDGVLAASNVTDYCVQHPYGTTYEIRYVTPNTGKTYEGASSGSGGGTITAATTVELKFRTNAYTVAYDANGGTGTTASSTHTYGVAKDLTANAFTRAGYSFTGWRSLPDGYTLVEYVQATGTQWIDSGAAIGADTWVDADLMFDSAFDWNMMFGAWGDLSVSLKAAKTVCVAVGGAETQNVGSTTTTGVKYNVKLGPGMGYTQDGVRSQIGGSSNTGSGRHVLLFAASDASTGNQPYKWTSYGVGKIYGFKIYDGSTLVRNFVPVTNASGEAGMFDLVEGMFYGNSGTGSFTAGPAVDCAYEDQESVVNLTSADGAIVTMYAQWSRTSYAITYDLDGGSVSPANPTSYNVDTATFTLNNPTKTGHAFQGWNEQISTSNWYSGFINLSTGAIETNASYPNSVYSERIFLEAGKVYRLSADVASDDVRWRYFDADGNYLGSVSGYNFQPDVDVYASILLYNGCSETARNAATIDVTENQTISTSNWYSGFINFDTGAVETSASYPNSVYSEFIELEAGVTYTISGNALGGIRWRYYDADKSYLGSLSSSNTFTPSVEGYVRILLYEGASEADRNAATITGSGVAMALDTEVVVEKGSTGDRHYTANWKINSFTLTVVPNGGTWEGSTENQTFTQDYGTTKAIADPSRTGYSFTGWTLSGSGTFSNSTYTYEEGDGTLTAQWSPVTYANTISHWAWGLKNGEGSGYNKSGVHLGTNTFTAEYGSTYVLNASNGITPPNGYTLSQYVNTPWLSDDNSTWKHHAFPVTVTQKAASMSFQYDYQPITYTITYEMGAGTNSPDNPSTYNVLYGFTLADPVSAPVGYVFSGWYIDSTEVTGVNEGCDATFSSGTDMYEKLAARTTGNLVIKALWTPITYYVSYDGNGATDGEMTADLHTYDIEKALSPNAFSYKVTGSFDGNGGTPQMKYADGLRPFAGWNSLASGGGTAYSDEQRVKNLTDVDGATVTIYAQWDPAVITLPEAPERSGFKFTGWFTSPEGGELVGQPGDSVSLLEDETFYAQWEKGAVRVYVYADGVRVWDEEAAAGEPYSVGNEAIKKATRESCDGLDGFYVDNAYVEKYVDGTVIEEDLYLYARNEATVYFDVTTTSVVNDRVIYEDPDLEERITVSDLLPDPIKTYYGLVITVPEVDPAYFSDAGRVRCATAAGGAYANPNGSGTPLTSAKVLGTTTLYYHWSTGGYDGILSD